MHRVGHKPQCYLVRTMLHQKGCQTIAFEFVLVIAIEVIWHVLHISINCKQQNCFTIFKGKVPEFLLKGQNYYRALLTFFLNYLCKVCTYVFNIYLLYFQLPNLNITFLLILLIPTVH